MNKVLVAETRPHNLEANIFYVQLCQASNLLPILRTDYFSECHLTIGGQINNSQLKFLMHAVRILNAQGCILAQGPGQALNIIKPILKNLGLFVKSETAQQVVFSKKQSKSEQVEKKEGKLRFGFKSLGEEQIDEEDLLKNQGINLNKVSTGSCADKPRACANCNCGRKANQQLPSKEELVKSVNEGKPVSGCGKCYLGDSFRCATCPYQGLPAFKPGDKLKLVDDTKVVVQSSTTIVSNGKVKIQL